MLKLVQSFVEKRFSDLTIKYSAAFFANFKGESYIDFRTIFDKINSFGKKFFDVFRIKKSKLHL